MNQPAVLALADLADALARLAKELARQDDRDPRALLRLADAAVVAVACVQTDPGTLLFARKSCSVVCGGC